MPHDYSPKQKAFISGGRKVSRQVVRQEIHGLIEHVGKAAAKLAGRLRTGKISAAQFETAMQELMKSGHIISASVGKGGRARMTQADWGQVGAKIKWQYNYLAKFTRKINGKILSDSAIEARARSYSSAIYTSFAKTFKESQTEFVEGGNNPELCRLVVNSEEGCSECAADASEGWVSVDDMAEIGSRICGDFCKCEIEFSADEGDEAPKIKIKVTVDDE